MKTGLTSQLLPGQTLPQMKSRTQQTYPWGTYPIGEGARGPDWNQQYMQRGTPARTASSLRLPNSASLRAQSRQRSSQIWVLLIHLIKLRTGKAVVCPRSGTITVPAGDSRHLYKKPAHDCTKAVKSAPGCYWTHLPERWFSFFFCCFCTTHIRLTLMSATSLDSDFSWVGNLF